jgi:hypothetical protein
MKRIKLFENFTNEEKYLWPEAALWIEELYPEEICFLALYVSVIEYNKKLTYNRSVEDPLFSIKTDYKSYELEPGSYNDDEDGISNFELYYEIPSKNKENCTLSIDVVGKGHFTKFREGGYMKPDEGGEPILDSVGFDSAYYLDSNEQTEINFSDSSYVFKSDILTKKDLTNIMKYVAAQRIEAHDETDTIKPFVPQRLMNKCEDIRKKYPAAVKGGNLLGRFGIFGTK